MDNYLQRNDPTQTDTLVIPSAIASHAYIHAPDPRDETTRPTIPAVTRNLNNGQEISDPFASENALLASGAKHMFVKVANRVYLKVRALYINENNQQFLTLLIDGESDEVWLTVPWNFHFETCYGKQKFLW